MRINRKVKILLKIYSVSDKYINYLRKDFPNVYSNKENRRKHTRKYIGVVLELEGYHYYVPMSSPKDSDYQIAGENRVIKKSIIPIIWIIVRNSKGQKELKGTLRISHMIPVPASELELYDYENEEDLTYKDLIHDEIIFIRKNKDKIMKNAQVMYKQKMNQDESAGYIKSALPFKQLEEMSDSFHCQWFIRRTI